MGVGDQQFERGDRLSGPCDKRAVALQRRFTEIVVARRSLARLKTIEVGSQPCDLVSVS